MSRRVLDPPCPVAERHTPAPAGYLEWHEWAAKKAKTHRQIICDGCDRYRIWVPKRSREERYVPGSHERAAQAALRERQADD
jgi:hypothetical protein